MTRRLARAWRRRRRPWQGLLAALPLLLASPLVAAEDDEEASAIATEPSVIQPGTPPATTPAAPAEPMSEHHPAARERPARTRSMAGGSGDSVAGQRGWNRVDPADLALHQGHARPPLVIHTDGKTAPYVIDAQTDAGGFDEAASALASEAFGAYKGGPALHPRLLDLIYRATRHFGAASILVVSGIRRDRQASRHSHGMAADIVLPGVKNEELAAYFREQGFTGVGTYPRAGFVHIDVRSESYFWVDRSPPNKRWKDVQVRGNEGRAADAAALLRGELPTPDPPRLKNALAKRGSRARRGPRSERQMPSRSQRDPELGAEAPQRDAERPPNPEPAP